MLAFPLAMGLAGPLGGGLADRLGPRPTAVAGCCLTALGLLLLVPLGGTWSPAEVAWRLALAGAGMGLYGGPVQALVMTAAPADRMATGRVGRTARPRSRFRAGPGRGHRRVGLAGRGEAGVRAGLGLAAAAACAAVVLLAVVQRAPRTAGAPELIAADCTEPAGSH
ncbi:MULTISPECIES: MFS transporter [Protofrankia]|uniref:Major Facilitator Superfamily protein n=1 Tax=Protofrankia coriariae TaxID=1562887 RepID=A0ABR5F745_9ACTN|nr:MULTISPECIES: MFS transporter [Protofrankia]KLL12539.1 hypothetical protein FrCorBMG51_04675 [Protofrankia coriariae]ONH35437.1 hypothetical protein BL254_10760 [Protofrankia sp. BMG5.30]